MGVKNFLLALLLFSGAAQAQSTDDRTIKSPDGQLEFRLFTALPDDSIFNCLAYQVWLRGKPVIETSYLGLDILFQEPLLGENVGLSADHPVHGSNYNGLWADYLQTSTTGRRIQFEVRVWNEGLAFRYIVPRSALLFDLAIFDDTTQYRLPPTTVPNEAQLPFTRELPGLTWIRIDSQEIAGYPKPQLKKLDNQTLVTHLPGGIAEQQPAFKTQTPWTGPWHIIAIAPARDKLSQSVTDRLQ